MLHVSSNTPPLVEDIRALLDSGDWGMPMRGYRSVKSTNTIAREWAADGAPEGGVVLTEEQTAGKGRLGRRWHAHAGQNLLFSVVLRPQLPADYRGLITLAGGVATAETIEEAVTPYRPVIKWPNDILLEGRKCCGMLLETAYSMSANSSAVILGIGLNVNQTTFSRAFAAQATSLRLMAGRTIDRAAFFVQLLRSLRRWYRRLQEDNGASVRSAFMEKMIYKGRRVRLCYTDQETAIEGVVEGVDETGGLLLRHDGNIRTFHAGEVTFTIED